jgi:hypothetical protein
MADIPLKILVFDPEIYSVEILCDTLSKMKNVIKVKRSDDFSEVKGILANDEINTIFIDPVSLGIEITSELIFSIRADFPYIVFVLYVELKIIEQIETEFYEGKRAKFRHYYKLDKGMPLSTFKNELTNIVKKCQEYLTYSLSTAKIGVLQNEITIIKENANNDNIYLPASSIARIEEQLVSLRKILVPPQRDVKPNSIFLSYRFIEKEYKEVLKTFLEEAGFHIITGEDANKYISHTILQRIDSCQFFLCLMTRVDEKKDGSFTVSPWLLEEKGAAIALNKKIILMVEEGVVDIGGLEGDWQRIYFKPKTFAIGVKHAIDQLKSYDN